MKREPTEQIDSNNIAFSDDGRNDGACTTGNTELNRAKYNLMHRFYYS